MKFYLIFIFFILMSVFLFHNKQIISNNFQLPLRMSFLWSWSGSNSVFVGPTIFTVFALQSYPGKLILGLYVLIKLFFTSTNISEQAFIIRSAKVLISKIFGHNQVLRGFLGENSMKIGFSFAEIEDFLCLESEIFWSFLDFRDPHTFCLVSPIMLNCNSWKQSWLAWKYPWSKARSFYWRTRSGLFENE